MASETPKCLNFYKSVILCENINSSLFFLSIFALLAHFGVCGRSDCK